jgi:hypothetical protein
MPEAPHLNMNNSRRYGRFTLIIKNRNADKRFTILLSRIGAVQIPNYYIFDFYAQCLCTRYMDLRLHIKYLLTGKSVSENLSYNDHSLVIKSFLILLFIRSNLLLGSLLQ